MDENYLAAEKITRTRTKTHFRRNGESSPSIIGEAYDVAAFPAGGKGQCERVGDLTHLTGQTTPQRRRRFLHKTSATKRRQILQK